MSELGHRDPVGCLGWDIQQNLSLTLARSGVPGQCLFRPPEPASRAVDLTQASVSEGRRMTSWNLTTWAPRPRTPTRVSFIGKVKGPAAQP